MPIRKRSLIASLVLMFTALIGVFSASIVASVLSIRNKPEAAFSGYTYSSGFDHLDDYLRERQCYTHEELDAFYDPTKGNAYHITADVFDDNGALDQTFWNWYMQGGFSINASRFEKVTYTSVLQTRYDSDYIQVTDVYYDKISEQGFDYSSDVKKQYGFFVINDAGGLHAFSRLVAMGFNFNGRRVVVADDINLDGDVFYPIGAVINEWNVYNGNKQYINNVGGQNYYDILDYSCFSGEFDARYHTIRNFNINVSNRRHIFAGFFAWIYNGHVRNLRLKDYNIRVTNDTDTDLTVTDADYATVHIGGIAGLAGGGTVNIEHCQVENLTIDVSNVSFNDKHYTQYSGASGMVGLSYYGRVKSTNMALVGAETKLRYLLNLSEIVYTYQTLIFEHPNDDYASNTYLINDSCLVYNVVFNGFDSYTKYKIDTDRTVGVGPAVLYDANYAVEVDGGLGHYYFLPINYEKYEEGDNRFTFHGNVTISQCAVSDEVSYGHLDTYDAGGNILIYYTERGSDESFECSYREVYHIAEAVAGLYASDILNLKDDALENFRSECEKGLIASGDGGELLKDSIPVGPRYPWFYDGANLILRRFSNLQTIKVKLEGYIGGSIDFIDNCNNNEDLDDNVLYEIDYEGYFCIEIPHDASVDNIFTKNKESLIYYSNSLYGLVFTAVPEGDYVFNAWNYIMTGSAFRRVTIYEASFEDTLREISFEAQYVDSDGDKIDKEFDGSVQLFGSSGNLIESVEDSLTIKIPLGSYIYLIEDGDNGYAYYYEYNSSTYYIRYIDGTYFDPLTVKNHFAEGSTIYCPKNISTGEILGYGKVEEDSKILTDVLQLPQKFWLYAKETVNASLELDDFVESCYTVEELEDGYKILLDTGSTLSVDVGYNASNTDLQEITYEVTKGTTTRELFTYRANNSYSITDEVSTSETIDLYNNEIYYVIPTFIYDPITVRFTLLQNTTRTMTYSVNGGDPEADNTTYTKTFNWIDEDETDGIYVSHSDIVVEVSEDGQTLTYTFNKVEGTNKTEWTISYKINDKLTEKLYFDPSLCNEVIMVSKDITLPCKYSTYAHVVLQFTLIPNAICGYSENNKVYTIRLFESAYNTERLVLKYRVEEVYHTGFGRNLNGLIYYLEYVDKGSGEIKTSDIMTYLAPSTMSSGINSAGLDLDYEMTDDIMTYTITPQTWGTTLEISSNGDGISAYTYIDDNTDNPIYDTTYTFSLNGLSFGEGYDTKVDDYGVTSDAHYTINTYNTIDNIDVEISRNFSDEIVEISYTFTVNHLVYKDGGYFDVSYAPEKYEIHYQYNGSYIMYPYCSDSSIDPYNDIDMNEVNLNLIIGPREKTPIGITFVDYSTYSSVYNINGITMTVEYGYEDGFGVVYSPVNANTDMVTFTTDGVKITIPYDIEWVSVSTSSSINYEENKNDYIYNVDFKTNDDYYYYYRITYDLSAYPRCDLSRHTLIYPPQGEGPIEYDEEFGSFDPYDSVTVVPGLYEKNYNVIG